MWSIFNILHKNFQEDQLNSRRFPEFPGGFLNSTRFQGFPGVVDTLVEWGKIGWLRAKREQEAVERRVGVTKIGLSGERQIGRSRSAHMLCSPVELM